MARYDALIKEMGFRPARRSYDPVALLAGIQRAGRESPLAKALTGLQKQMSTTARQNRAAVQRLTEDPRVAHRAKLASVQKRVGALIQAGKLTAHEGALIEVHMHAYAAKHCQ